MSIKRGVMEDKIVTFNFEEEILVGAYRPGLEIDLNIAKQIIKERKSLMENPPYLILLDARGLKSINREAREYLSSKESYEGVLAGALLADSVFTTYLANFFLKVTSKKDTAPIKLFTKKHKAIKWLKAFN